MRKVIGKYLILVIHLFVFFSRGRVLIGVASSKLRWKKSPVNPSVQWSVSSIY